MTSCHLPLRNSMLVSLAASICLFLSACAYSVCLNYYIYEPSVELSEGAKCALCKWTGGRIAPNVLKLNFTETGDEVSIATYDPIAYRGFIYQYGPLDNRTEALSERHTTTEVQLRITLACRGASDFAFVPGTIRLVDQTSGADIPLRRFSEYSPAESAPSSKSINDGIFIDRGEPIGCQGHRPRSIVASFDFHASLTKLRLSFESSLAVGNSGLSGLNVQFRLNAHSDYLYKSLGLNFG